jgi:hypothetical protein
MWTRSWLLLQREMRNEGSPRSPQAAKIDAVMIGGRLLDRKSLDEMLAKAEAAARKNL